MVEGIPMDEARFRATLGAAIESEGAEYLRARTLILREGAAAVQRVEAWRPRSATWQEALVADLFLLWLQEPILCHQVRKLMRGDLPRSSFNLPVTGTWSAGDRADELLKLGPPAVLGCLEILVKSREAEDWEQTVALFETLRKSKEARAAEPLVHLLVRGDSDLVRERSAKLLAGFGFEKAQAPLTRIFSDRTEATPLRRAAAVALLKFNAVAAVSALRGVLLEGDEPAALRGAAAGVLAALEGKAAAELLHGVLSAPQQPAELLSSLVFTVVSVPHPQTAVTLEALAREHPDASVRRQAALARRSMDSSLPPE